MTVQIQGGSDDKNLDSEEGADDDDDLCHLGHNGGYFLYHFRFYYFLRYTVNIKYINIYFLDEFNVATP